MVSTIDGVIVRDDNPVEVVDFGRKKLLPHVGTAIDQQPLSAAFDEDGRPAPPVPWLCGIAGSPVIPDPRYACRSAATQDRQLHAVARENNRKKLSVVVSARASGVS